MCDNCQEPLKLQQKVFMEEVQQQLMLPTIRSYLKLYTTMPLDKMAGFMEMQEEEFRNHLLAFKHKMKNVVWTKVGKILLLAIIEHNSFRAPPGSKVNLSLDQRWIST